MNYPKIKVTFVIYYTYICNRHGCQKTRTMQKASKIMIEALQKDIKERIDPIHEDMSEAHIMIAYTYDRDLALEFKKEVEEAFPNHEVICDPLSLSVACHIGPHSLAIGACKKI